MSSLTWDEVGGSEKRDSHTLVSPTFSPKFPTCTDRLETAFQAVQLCSVRFPGLYHQPRPETRVAAHKLATTLRVVPNTFSLSQSYPFLHSGSAIHSESKCAHNGHFHWPSKKLPPNGPNPDLNTFTPLHSVNSA